MLTLRSFSVPETIRPVTQGESNPTPSPRWSTKIPGAQSSAKARLTSLGHSRLAARRSGRTRTSARDTFRTGVRCAGEVVGHVVGESDLHGRDESVAVAESVDEMVPDHELTFDPTFSGSDVHCGHWRLRGTREGALSNLGIEPMGTEVECSGRVIDRIEDGRIVVMCHQVDSLTQMQQVGAFSE